MEVQVSLGFACCVCEEAVTVTVKCAGVTAQSRAVAAVNVPCPNCGLINQLAFEPNGTVRSVDLYGKLYPLPEPSLN